MPSCMNLLYQEITVPKTGCTKRLPENKNCIILSSFQFLFLGITGSMLTLSLFIFSDI